MQNRRTVYKQLNSTWFSIMHSFARFWVVLIRKVDLEIFSVTAMGHSGKRDWNKRCLDKWGCTVLVSGNCTSSTVNLVTFCHSIYTNREKALCTSKINVLQHMPKRCAWSDLLWFRPINRLVVWCSWYLMVHSFLSKMF